MIFFWCLLRRIDKFLLQLFSNKHHALFNAVCVQYFEYCGFWKSSTPPVKFKRFVSTPPTGYWPQYLPHHFVITHTKQGMSNIRVIRLQKINQWGIYKSGQSTLHVYFSLSIVRGENFVCSKQHATNLSYTSKHLLSHVTMLHQLQWYQTQFKFYFRLLIITHNYSRCILRKTVTTLSMSLLL